MKILITGGAGYIGSLLTGALLSQGHQVTVLDDLLFGGDAILPYFIHPAFAFHKFDVTTGDLAPHLEGVGAVYHLAALVGFPACQRAGDEASWAVNTGAVERVFQAAEAAGVGRLVFSSTYSNYGIAPDNRPVDESSPLHPQSTYAETKIAAEQYLLGQAATSRCAPLVYRFATLYGLSPRTRFDLLVNQFVLEAVTTHALLIYQRRYARSFVHIRDVVRALALALDAPEPLIRGEVYNVGSDDGNYTKEELALLVAKHVPGTEITFKDMAFDGDMRDVRVSFAKITSRLGFRAAYDIEYGIREIRDALELGLIKEPFNDRYRNAPSLLKGS
ncbi:MAG: NAD(P)-dependent oxidoreductase [Chloroflexi bacterium]|nr:NAD(P)-dependent oxidoreductase [Chloroflexota bacterium]